MKWIESYDINVNCDCEVIDPIMKSSRKDLVHSSSTNILYALYTINIVKKFRLLNLLAELQCYPPTNSSFAKMSGPVSESCPEQISNLLSHVFVQLIVSVSHWCSVQSVLSVELTARISVLVVHDIISLYIDGCRQWQSSKIPVRMNSTVWICANWNSTRPIWLWRHHSITRRGCTADRTNAIKWVVCRLISLTYGEKKLNMVFFPIFSFRNSQNKKIHPFFSVFFTLVRHYCEYRDYNFIAVSEQFSYGKSFK